MNKYANAPVLTWLIIILVILACNLPTATPAVDSAGTREAHTQIAAQTAIAGSLAAPAVPEPSQTAGPLSTDTPAVTATPKNPVVSHTALCWQGPGNAYEVVSSIKTGVSVQLIGIGSIAGWYIVINPVYHDPCWIQASNLQIDPAMDLSGLRVYNPPPTPGPTETPVPTDTP